VAEDKRITKTKNNLKQTFARMLSKKSFEQITVKELCEESGTSRVTFYAHYKDKYDFLDDISKDMIKIAQDEYKRLQKENNFEKNPVLSYCNFLDCILSMYYENFEFFSHTSPYENPYLNFSFYSYILQYLEIHTRKRSRSLKPRYNIKRTAAFLCHGLWGFINESRSEKCSAAEVRVETRKILKDILKQGILTENII
jgi:AcrR family transcriptional regulator